MLVIRLNNWKELQETLEEINPHIHSYQGSPFCFRGHSDSDWKINSTLSRIVSGDSLSEKKAKYYEWQSVAEFAAQMHLLDEFKFKEKIDVDKILKFLPDMQHYSCPTRLVDWSMSPYVALYFAVNENYNKDGCLFIWESVSYGLNCKELNQDPYSVKGLEMLEFNSYDFVQIIYSLQKNERTVRQQGLFSISNNILKNHCDIINDAGNVVGKPSGLIKLIINSDLKKEFLARLKVMNISSSSLFPGVDGLGRSIKEQLELRRWSRL